MQKRNSNLEMCLLGVNLIFQICLIHRIVVSFITANRNSIKSLLHLFDSNFWCLPLNPVQVNWLNPNIKFNCLNIWMCFEDILCCANMPRQTLLLNQTRMLYACSTKCYFCTFAVSVLHPTLSYWQHKQLCLCVSATFSFNLLGDNSIILKHLKLNCSRWSGKDIVPCTIL